MRRTITVLLVKPPNYIHWQAYQEMAEFVLYGCRSLSDEADLTSDVKACKGQTIAIGAHVMSPADAEMLPPNTIIYNSEHTGSAWIKNERYSALLRRHTIWDYSHSNATRLSALLGKEVNFVKIGYDPHLTRVEARSTEDIDVLFYGSTNARRQLILDGMRESGLSVHQAFGVYGRERDELISRSKVVANIHYYEPGSFEIVRTSYLLANRKAVVTESNGNDGIDIDLVDAVFAVPYGQLIDACRTLVGNDAQRKALERKGFESFSSRDAAAILKNALCSNSTNHAAQPISAL